jgi:hypothetical protein
VNTNVVPTIEDREFARDLLRDAIGGDSGRNAVLIGRLIEAQDWAQVARVLIAYQTLIGIAVGMIDDGAKVEFAITLAHRFAVTQVAPTAEEELEQPPHEQFGGRGGEV